MYLLISKQMHTLSALQHQNELFQESCKSGVSAYILITKYLMKGAGKVVSKSYSWACDVELTEKSNTLQIWSICLLITSGYNGIALFEGIRNLLFLLSNNICSCYNFSLDSYLYSHVQHSTVDTQSAKPYSYSFTCTT